MTENWNWLYIGVLIVLVVTSGALVGFPVGANEATPEASSSPDRPYNTTAAGVRYTVHPSELIQGCPGGKDCIPSIDDPRFESADEATWLRSSDRVIGVEVDGEAKAYPLRILNVHEIVNDEIAGRPIAVTYCPLCRSGLVYSRVVGERTLTFGVSGKLLNANLVMYDRQTETYWSQVTAEAIVGPLVPRTLDLQPSSITTWEQWRSAHPETRVLSRDTDIYPPATYGSNPYEGYARSDRVGFGVNRVDDRLPSKEIVYGVTVGGISRAYPERVVNDRNVINDEINGVPVLVVEDQRTGGVTVFIRQVDNTTLTFAISDGRLVDGNGSRWSFDGEALDGPYRGTRLEPLNTHGFYWFAWSSFHPETEIYRGTR